MNTIRMDADEWQIACWELARNKKPFEVAGVCTDQRLFFLEELCAAYGYELELRDRTVIFTLKIQNTKLPNPTPDQVSAGERAMQIGPILRA